MQLHPSHDATTGRHGQGGILRAIRRFRRDNRGIAAIEFAIILPLMIAMYIGTWELVNAQRAARKVTILSRALADLSSQYSDINNATRDDIFNAAKAVLAPFPSTNAGMVVTSIRFDATGKAFVDWSEAKGSGVSAYARCGTPPAIPNDLRLPNTSVILAEARFDYVAIVKMTANGTITLKDQLFMRPRIADFVTRNGVSNPVCA